MDYQKVTIQLSNDTQDFRDILMASLGELGYESFYENQDNIEAFVPMNLFSEDNLKVLDFSPMFTFTFSLEFIKDQNWNEVWEKNYFQPLVVAEKCVIRAPFHTEYPKAEYEIIIEPKMAFGTGNHETTSLMLEHILENDMNNKQILDMGCGTGVLAILASMRNASKITAIDIDKWSFESASENAQINNCKNITVKHGDASLLGDESFDIIFANIHKNILIEDIKKYVSVLNSGGMLFMSGFYEHDLVDINNSAKSLNLNIFSTKTRKNWVAAGFRKP